MKPLFAILSLLTLTGITATTTAAVAAEARVVGGVTPAHRPDGMPTVSSFEFDRKQALHGVTKPYPPSIERWLDDQGAWYTPFSHPGMTAPYDIRNWHEKFDG